MATVTLITWLTNTLLTEDAKVHHYHIACPYYKICSLHITVQDNHRPHSRVHTLPRWSDSESDTQQSKYFAFERLQALHNHVFRRLRLPTHCFCSPTKPHSQKSPETSETPGVFPNDARPQNITLRANTPHYYNDSCIGTAYLTINIV